MAASRGPGAFIHGWLEGSIAFAMETTAFAIAFAMNCMAAVETTAFPEPRTICMVAVAAAWWWNNTLITKTHTDENDHSDEMNLERKN